MLHLGSIESLLSWMPFNINLPHSIIINNIYYSFHQLGENIHSIHIPHWAGLKRKVCWKTHVLILVTWRSSAPVNLCCRLLIIWPNKINLNWPPILLKSFFKCVFVTSWRPPLPSSLLEQRGALKMDVRLHLPSPAGASMRLPMESSRCVYYIPSETIAPSDWAQAYAPPALMGKRLLAITLVLIEPTRGGYLILPPCPVFYLALINTVYPLICTSASECDGQITPGLGITGIDRDAGTGGEEWGG